MEKGSRMRVLNTTFALLAAALLLSLTACNQKPGGKILAKVNGVPLTEADLKYEPPAAHGLQNQQTGGPKNINDIINQELLYQQGLRLGLDQDPSFQKKLASFSTDPQAKRLEMARRVFSVEIASKAEVNHVEAKAYYEKNADQIATELHLLMAKFATRAEAEEALKKLKQGAEFASVAGQAGKAAAGTGRERWDLGFVKWQQVPVDFLDQLYGLKPGEVAGPMGNHRTGFQIVKLVEKRKLPDQGYDAVAAMVTARLRDLRLLNAYNEYLDKLRKGANVVTF
jgi:peptidyl-prolyl cis-trans isomerase C